VKGRQTQLHKRVVINIRQNIKLVFRSMLKRRLAVDCYVERVKNQ